MSEPVLLEEWGEGYGVLTLNRPDKLNAFNDALHGALKSALDIAASNKDCRALLLTGSGRAFCAGQDLGDRDPAKMDGPPNLGETLETLYNPLIRRIRSLDMPVICAVNGVAAGAGANIALACDIVLAAKSARFIQAFSKIGLIPDSGGSWSLTRLVGEARAKAVAMTATPIDAETAESWGMIWRSVPDAELLLEARTLLRDFAAGPTLGHALTKQAVHAAASNTLDEQLDLERDFQQRAGRSSDYAEGVSAFLEKRKPRFTGRE